MTPRHPIQLRLAQQPQLHTAALNAHRRAGHDRRVLILSAVAADFPDRMATLSHGFHRPEPSRSTSPVTETGSGRPVRASV